MTSTSYWLVVPAAGRGARYGGDTPKQYLSLGGRTVLEHALAPFLADPRLSGAVVALDPGDAHYATLPLAADRRVERVTGGAERADSVRAGLARVADLAEGADPWVLVHDAARPLVTRTEIDALVGALGDSPDGALLALPVADTLKRAADDGRVAATVDRSGLWRALTPQAFRLSRLMRALAAAGGRQVTDEAQAIEADGGRPRLVPGLETNLKVTRPGDLAIAARLLAPPTGA